MVILRTLLSRTARTRSHFGSTPPGKPAARSRFRRADVLTLRDAWRRDLPTLKFCFLVFRQDDLWRAHSVLTGPAVEGSSAEDAIQNLTRAIDAEISLAKELGLTPEAWFETREPDEAKYLLMFAELVRDVGAEVREDSAPRSGSFVLEAPVVKAAA